MKFDSTEKSQITERKIRVNWLAATSDDGAAPAVVATPAKQTGAVRPVCSGSFCTFLTWLLGRRRYPKCISEVYFSYGRK